MKVFLTSDTFFGRELSAIQGGFESAEEMDEVIIDNWNSRVKPDDIVYHLGNFAWDPISAESALAFLNGTIFFVGGEYDKHMSENSLVKVGKHHLLPVISEVPKMNSVLSHWPLHNWLGKSEGVMHFHGGEKIESNIPNRWCVNIKNWNWSPIDIDFFNEITKKI